MGILRIRKVRVNDDNGMCRRETIPANPVFPQGDVNDKWTLARYVLSKRTKHMYGTFIVNGEGHGCVWQNPIIGNAGVLRKLVVQIPRSEFKLGNNYSGRTPCTLVRGSTNRFEPRVPSMILYGSVAPSTFTKTQVLFSTRHTPSGRLQ